MREFELRELKSRRLKTVTPILWVGAVVSLTAQGFPGWQAPTQFKQSQERKLQSVLELNVRPETPTGYYSGYYPGSKAVKAETKRSNYTLTLTPELNSYPPTPAPVTYSAIVESGYNFNKGLARTRLDVELNEYPSTPAGYYSGYYPGSELATGFKSEFNRSLQTVELNEYPSLPPSVADISAVTLEKGFYRKRVKYDAREAIFAIAYVIEVAPPSLTFGLHSLITDTMGLNSTIKDTQGLSSSISNTFGLSSKIS